MMKKRSLISILLIVTLCVVLGLVFIQVLPFGRSHQNPPVVQEPQWDSPRTRELAKKACFDCHSNETVWPWYSNIAPISWLVQHDVDEGREKLNFSDVMNSEFEQDELVEVVQEGKMPPAIYLIQHPESRLTAAEIDELANGLQKTVAGGGN
jgi:hypothetical protein